MRPPTDQEAPTATGHDVPVDGTIYNVDFSFDVVQIDPVPCPLHNGNTAHVTTCITIHDIRDEADQPLPEVVDLETLEARILEVMRNGKPQCIECDPFDY